MQEERQTPINDAPKSKYETFSEILKTLKINHEIVLLYTNANDTLKFSAGYVLEVMDEQFMMKHISPDDMDDGIYMSDIANIIKIETNTRYSNRLKILTSKLDESNVTDFCGNLYKGMLLKAMYERSIISVELGNSGEMDAMGFVLAVSDRIVHILSIDDYGVKDGDCFIQLNQITQLTCDGIEERKISLLYSRNYVDSDLHDAEKRDP